MKKQIPWWTKIAIKIVWSRLPFRYGFWRRMGVFRHGFMDNPKYVYNVFSSHWSRVEFARKREGCQALELGCGDSLASCQIAAAHDVRKCYLVDVGKFATMKMDFYTALADALRRDGIQVRDVAQCKSVSEMLSVLNAEYL